MSAEHQLITPRRNFLIRALGFTAAGATVAVPITTLASARARIDHHIVELEKALRDQYEFFGVDVFMHIHLPEPGSIGYDKNRRRRYRTQPIVFFGHRGQGWID